MLALDQFVALPEGVRLEVALAINERGQVIAQGSDGMAWLLTPRAAP